MSRPAFPIADRPAIAEPSHSAVAPAPLMEPGVLVTAGDDVPAIRSETRSRIGPGDTPMVEVDHAGRIQFVGGDWFALTGFTKPGAAPLNVLGSRSTHSEQLPVAIERAIRDRTPTVLDFEASSGSSGCHLMVLPIPSPIVGGQMNALVGVSQSDDLNFSPAPASSARYVIKQR